VERAGQRNSALSQFEIGLVTASRNCELAGNRCEDALDLIAEPDQNRDGDNGNKSQDQGVLDQSLALPVLIPKRGGHFYGFHYRTKTLELPK
jgi:hypothetical protein